MKRMLTVRFDDGQREKLLEIASLNHNTPSGLIRLAVDRLIAEAQRYGGALPVASAPFRGTQRVRNVRAGE
jgi:hypothetical protein